MRRLLLLIPVISLTACNTLFLAGETGPKPVDISVEDKQPLISPDIPTIDEVVLQAAQMMLEAEQVRRAEAERLARQHPDDLWERIRRGFRLPEVDNKRVRSEFDWYARHPAYMERVAERAQPYLHYVVETIEESGIPTELALLPIVESAFQPFAYSHGRAAGIWQFIPSTGRLYGLKQNWWYDGRRDVYASTHAAVDLLKTLHRQFKGDWLLALAAYNSGSGTVKRAIRNNKRRGKPTDFWSLKLPPETRSYVPKLLALKRLIQNPETYDLALPKIDNQPYLARVLLDSQIDLARAAELADIPLDELYRLNPGFNRWATAPDGPHQLFIPREKVDVFATRLAALPPQQRIRWIRHRIRKGETLSTIAVRYNTSIGTIKKVNHLRSSRLRAGHNLMIPVASKSASSYKLSAAQRKQASQNRPRKGTKVIHIVRKGDTFWDLSMKHRVNVRQLAKWNGMAPRDPLTPGQKLVIWSRKANASSSLDTTDYLLPTRRNVTKRIGYRVRKGDSLARISRKFNVSIHQLKRWNRNSLKKSRYLQPGQRLTVYVDVTAQSS